MFTKGWRQLPRIPKAAAFLLLISLLPILQFTYMARFSRPIADDYCYIAHGIEHGAFGAVQFMRTTWNGSYSDVFLHGLLAPLAERIPSIFQTATVILWFIGLCCLTLQALALLKVKENKLATALVFAGLLVAATINGFHSAQSFYFYAGSVRYTWPMVILIFYLAFTLYSLNYANGRWRTVAAALVGALICFINGGFSEMYLAFQGFFLTVVLFGVWQFAQRPVRRIALCIVGAGWLATAASAAAQFTAPGLHLRLASDLFSGIGVPVRTLPELAVRTAESSLMYIGQQSAFAGFALLFCVALFLTLKLAKPSQTPRSLVSSDLSAAPLCLCLGIQLLFLPFLFAHVSDAQQVLGRFSIAYFSVVCLNGLLITGLLLVLFYRLRFSMVLSAEPRVWHAYISTLLLTALVFFAATQVRNIHHKAATYLFLSSIAILGMACWQLQSLAPGATGRQLWRLSAFVSLQTLLSYGVLIGLSLYVTGFIEGRIMASSNALHVLAGIPWGVCLGVSLWGSMSFGNGKDNWAGEIKMASLIVALVIGFGIFAGQRPDLPRLARFAQEWDERHPEILRQREQGHDVIVVPPLSYNLGETLLGFQIFDDSFNGCPKLYYGVESITRSGAG